MIIAAAADAAAAEALRAALGPGEGAHVAPAPPDLGRSDLAAGAEAAVKGAKATVHLISAAALRSPWCRFAARVAREAAAAGGARPVAVLLEPVDRHDVAMLLGGAPHVPQAPPFDLNRDLGDVTTALTRQAARDAERLTYPSVEAHAAPVVNETFQGAANEADAAREPTVAVPVAEDPGDVAAPKLDAAVALTAPGRLRLGRSGEISADLTDAAVPSAAHTLVLEDPTRAFAIHTAAQPTVWPGGAGTDGWRWRVAPLRIGAHPLRLRRISRPAAGEAEEEVGETTLEIVVGLDPALLGRRALRWWLVAVVAFVAGRYGETLLTTLRALVE